MTCNKNEFTVFGSVFFPSQKMLNLGRLIVFVGPEECVVETVSRVFKVVWITAEKGDLLFGSKNEADVCVFFESIEMIGASLVKRDYVAAETCRL